MSLSLARSICPLSRNTMPIRSMWMCARIDSQLAQLSLLLSTFYTHLSFAQPLTIIAKKDEKNIFFLPKRTTSNISNCFLHEEKYRRKKRKVRARLSFCVYAIADISANFVHCACDFLGCLSVINCRKTAFDEGGKIAAIKANSDSYFRDIASKFLF